MYEIYSTFLYDRYFIRISLAMKRYLFLATRRHQLRSKLYFFFPRIYIYVDLENGAGDIKRRMIYGQV